MAVVSEDHAGACTDTSQLLEQACELGLSARPRLISPAEVERHNGVNYSMWAVVDGFVVDASSFLDSHPGGLAKLLSTNEGAVGATGRPYSFSFSRGKNAHFPETGRRFSDGVKSFLSPSGTDHGDVLSPVEVVFPEYGSITILGKLDVA